MSDEQEMHTAHQILLDHVTNVPTVTAKVIRAAVAEYEALIVDRPSMERIGPTQLEGMLAQMDQALEVFERSVRGMRVHVAQTLAQLNAWQQEQPAAGGNGVP